MAVPMMPQTPLIVAEHLTKTFPLPDGKGTFTVLKDVSVTIRAGEVVALLGRSGSGKSTLLRMLAGLIPPSDGVVKNGDQVVIGANPDVAMVFQSFALLPWATVQENVELGLKARGVPWAARAAQALTAIDMVGLDGFESAYPKELSGGMQQRVGFARAFVMEPKRPVHGRALQRPGCADGRKPARRARDAVGGRHVPSQEHSARDP